MQMFEMNTECNLLVDKVDIRNISLWIIVYSPKQRITVLPQGECLATAIVFLSRRFATHGTCYSFSSR